MAQQAGFPWCGEGDNRYRSVTEMEIMEACLHNREVDPQYDCCEHAYFYFREDGHAARLAAEDPQKAQDIQTTYAEKSQYAQERMQSLKALTASPSVRSH